MVPDLPNNRNDGAHPSQLQRRNNGANLEPHKRDMASPAPPLAKHQHRGNPRMRKPITTQSEQATRGQAQTDKPAGPNKTAPDPNLRSSPPHLGPKMRTSLAAGVMTHQRRGKSKMEPGNQHEAVRRQDQCHQNQTRTHLYITDKKHLGPCLNETRTPRRLARNS